jgi:hypothetical protein
LTTKPTSKRFADCASSEAGRLVACGLAKANAGIFRLLQKTDL